MKTFLLAFPAVLGFFFAACKGGEVSEYNAEKAGPAAASAQAPVPEMRPMAAPQAAALVWADPAGFKRVQAQGMRLASYLVGGPDGEADMSIVVLPGESGGLLANVDRWRGQLGLPPLGGEQGLAGISKRVRTGGGEAVVVDLQGPAGVARKRILGAILRRDTETWFFKLNGPDRTVSGAKNDFMKMLSSLRPGRPA